jgi:hypothetical protein
MSISGAERGVDFLRRTFVAVKAKGWEFSKSLKIRSSLSHALSECEEFFFRVGKINCQDRTLLQD